ncbi:MAG: apolipoprotein N-acyltransferase [Nitrospiraceae bacterium]
MRSGLALQLLGIGATGLILPFCFPSANLFPLAWIALVPLHLVIETVSPKRALWMGWLSGTITFAGIMAWVVTAMHVYGKVPILPSYGVLILFAWYLASYTGAYAWGVARLARDRPEWLWIGAPALWTALELGRTFLLTGIPWALLGYSQGEWTTIIQIADMTGTYGLSFLIVLVNVGFVGVVRRMVPALASEHHVSLAPIGVALVALLGVWTYGTFQLQQAPNSTSAAQPEQDRATSPQITVGVVQANIDQASKWDERFRTETITRYTRLTKQAAQHVDLLLWPEAATPFVFEMEPAYQQLIGEVLREVDSPLLFGSPAVRRYPDGRPYLLNSAYLLSSQGKMLGRYDKQHLVPFGEYIPLHNSLLWFLDKLVEGIGDFEAGTQPTVLPVPQRIQRPSESRGKATPQGRGEFGVVICYEIIFPDLVRQFALNGADFMTTITNDAWFGLSAAPYQHFGMVQFRAVENRRAFARAANTGISGFIDPYGRVMQSGPLFEEAALVGTVPLRRDLTFYTRYGDVFARACVIIAALCLILSRHGDRTTRPTAER